MTFLGQRTLTDPEATSPDIEGTLAQPAALVQLSSKVTLPEALRYPGRQRRAPRTSGAGRGGGAPECFSLLQAPADLVARPRPLSPGRGEPAAGALEADPCFLRRACLTVTCPQPPRRGLEPLGRAQLQREVLASIGPALLVLELPSLRVLWRNRNAGSAEAEFGEAWQRDPEAWRRWIGEQDLPALEQLIAAPDWRERERVLELSANRPGGTPRWFETRYYPVAGSGGTRVAALVTDISEVKVREERLQSRVAEKDNALREIHHRVKNNLQIISSFLDLQTASLPPEAWDGIAAAQQRIRTMALLHEQLHSSPDPSHLDVETYFRELARRVLSATRPRFTLEVAIDVRGTVLSVDEVIPCGLILNELLQNAVKHGYPGQETGQVRVSFALAGSDLVLEVSDQGCGLPEGFELRNSPSLGLRVVQALARQLRGEVTAPSRRPAVFRLRFPASGGTKA